MEYHRSASKPQRNLAGQRRLNLYGWHSLRWIAPLRQGGEAHLVVKGHNMQVPLDITFQNSEPSDAIRSEVEKQAKRLEKIP
jgi:hypothetical protein